MRTRVSTAAGLAGWGLTALSLSLSGALTRVPSAQLLMWGLLVPAAAYWCLYIFCGPFRAMILSLPLRVLTLAEFPRTLGGTFLLWQYSRGLLPGLFALTTGISDIVFGITAVPVALWWIHPPQAPRSGFRLWHILSLAFLGISSTTGILDSPHSLSEFPSNMVPVFLGPLMIVIEIAALTQLGVRRQG